MSVTCEVKGLKELAEALNLMPKKLAGRALGASVKAGADLVRNAARTLAPVDTGAAKKSIMSWRKRGSRPDNIGYQVGVTLKKKWPRKRYRTYKGLFGITAKKTVEDVMQPAYWWRFNEFGTTKMAARPFIRPAWDQRSGQALAMIKKMLEKAVVIAAAQVPKYRG